MKLGTQISIMLITYTVSKDGLVEIGERYDLEQTVALFKKIFKNY
jgi:hypothetical protein